MRLRSACVALIVLPTVLAAGCTGARPSTSPAPSAPHPTASIHRHPKTAQTLTFPLPRPPRRQPWRITPAAATGIAGYVSRDSIAPGDPLDLYVSTSAKTFTVQVYRMGWYAGLLGTLTATLGPYPSVSQPAATVSPTLRMVTTAWTSSGTLDTAGWLPGVYLLRLTTPAGRANFVPLTVRGSSAAGRVVLITPDTTWQAYNRWGCCDLYDGDEGGFASRSYAVSFDRPYLAEFGAGEFIDRELPIVAEVDRLGLPVDFVTDIDLQRDPHILDGATAVISMGHDEYYSVQMRATLTAARDAGSNIAFLGSNAIYRRVRFESSPLGADRVMVDYKIGSLDPVSKLDPTQTTADWPQPPDAHPESSLTGGMYACLGHTSDGVVVDPTSYLFAGTHVVKGTPLTALMGPEVDRIVLADPTPRPIEILTHSPFACPQGDASEADTTYYSTPSGAAVFDAGTMRWVCAVYDGCEVDAMTGGIVRRVTDNLLLAFAQGPAGKAHPAHDNVADFLP
ncbi:MAG: hypothetical protein JO152_17330 [Mycobacteriaceae bacterium]|nr:hypothetical protein [Mycobacteriaceae bacterium]